jgi:hypothetical protein
MPYAVTVSVNQVAYDNRTYYYVRVDETDVETTSEYTVTGLPTHGEIITFSATTIAGRTIQPAFGRRTGFDPTDANEIENVSQQAAAARTFINDQSTVRFYNLTDGELFGQTTPDVNVVGQTVSEILIIGGIQV